MQTDKNIHFEYSFILVPVFGDRCSLVSHNNERSSSAVLATERSNEVNQMSVVYKGLDIASNKITEMERAEVPHHMLDICGPMDRFSVYDYRNRTLPIVSFWNNNNH
ncbi:hypothetical protein PGB90_005349 [Kerria lacca]